MRFAMNNTTRLVLTVLSMTLVFTYLQDEDIRAQSEKSQKLEQAQSKTSGAKPRRVVGPYSWRNDDFLEKLSSVDVTLLKGMKAADIRQISIYKITYKDGQNAKASYMEEGLGNFYRKEIEGLLALIRKAAPVSPPGPLGMHPIFVNNRVLVVTPKDGDPFGIRYSSDLSAPFGSVESRGLKEALYALSAGGESRIAIFRLSDKKVSNIIKTGSMPPQQGGTLKFTSEGEPKFMISIRTNLSAEGQLSVHLRIKQFLKGEVKDLVNGEKRLGYGEAAVFDTLSGDDMFLVFQQEPQEPNE